MPATLSLWVSSRSRRLWTSRQLSFWRISFPKVLDLNTKSGMPSNRFFWSQKKKIWSPPAFFVFYGQWHTGNHKLGSSPWFLEFWVNKVFSRVKNSMVQLISRSGYSPELKNPDPIRFWGASCPQPLFPGHNHFRSLFPLFSVMFS